MSMRIAQLLGANVLMYFTCIVYLNGSTLDKSARLIIDIGNSKNMESRLWSCPMTFTIDVDYFVLVQSKLDLLDP